MPNEPIWVPPEAVIEHNRREVEESGEAHFLRDSGLLESALARPRNFFAFGEDDVVVLAVTLMTGLARAHAFEQGNKRTAFEAMWHFLRLNGYDLSIADDERWADALTALIEHRATEDDITRLLRPHVIPFDIG